MARATWWLYLVVWLCANFLIGAGIARSTQGDWSRGIFEALFGLLLLIPHESPVSVLFGDAKEGRR